MKKQSYEEMIQALREVDRTPPPQPVDEFWNQFRARAEAIPRTNRQVSKTASPIVWPRWALGAVTVFALLVLALSIELPKLSNEQPQATQLSRVDEVNVFIEHSSVMIMNDQQHGGTLLWVTGTETGNDNHGS